MSKKGKKDDTANTQASNESEKETNVSDKTEESKVDTDEEKEQAYSTEITGHSVNLALCSYLRRRRVGATAGEGGGGKRRLSVVFLAGPTSKERFNYEILRNRQTILAVRLPVIFVVRCCCIAFPFFILFLSPSFYFCPLCPVIHSLSLSLFLPLFPLFPVSLFLFLYLCFFAHSYRVAGQLNKKGTYIVCMTQSKHWQLEKPDGKSSRDCRVLALGYLCLALYSPIAISQ